MQAVLGERWPAYGEASTHDLQVVLLSYYFELPEGQLHGTIVEANRLPVGLFNRLRVLPVSREDGAPLPLLPYPPSLPLYHLKLHKDGLTSRFDKWQALGTWVDVVDSRNMMPADEVSLHLAMFKETTGHELRFRYVDATDLVRIEVRLNAALPPEVLLKVEFNTLNAVPKHMPPPEDFKAVVRHLLVPPMTAGMRKSHRERHKTYLSQRVKELVPM